MKKIDLIDQNKKFTFESNNKKIHNIINKDINTPYVKRQVSNGNHSVSVSGTIPLKYIVTLQNWCRPIPKRHHKPNVFNLPLVLTLPLDAGCVHSFIQLLIPKP